ncbi:MAG: ASCH domain-containing protein [Methanobrevibacter sp.]|nr:ASCH domain-containing protein [Methanobrevibacter sp.]
MEKLYFYGEYVEPIKEGAKTSTIRRHFDGKVGDEIAAYETDTNPLRRIREFGFLEIKSIEYIRFDEINKEIARTEGYLHEDLLKESLYNIYDDLEESTLLYYVKFSFIPKEDEETVG